MWPNPQEKFSKEILNGKLHFLCSDIIQLRLVTAPGARVDLNIISPKTFDSNIQQQSPGKIALVLDIVECSWHEIDNVIIK